MKQTVYIVAQARNSSTVDVMAALTNKERADQVKVCAGPMYKVFPVEIDVVPAGIETFQKEVYRERAVVDNSRFVI